MGRPLAGMDLVGRRTNQLNKGKASRNREELTEISIGREMVLSKLMGSKASESPGSNNLQFSPPGDTG